MVSEARAAALTVAGAVAMGCTSSVHDASIATSPLLVLHGHVDVSSLTRTSADAPLLGALVWASVPMVSPVCLEFDTPEIKPACPDPYGVVSGEIAAAVPLDADGNFSLQLFALPNAAVSVGDEVTRIAWGSLIVVEDANRDGQPSLPRRRVRFEGPPDEGEPEPLDRGLDVIVGASFHTLHANQMRVAFREGGFVEGSSFYPLPGCEPPPPGFSILTAPPHSEAQPPVGGCVAHDTGMTVEVPALSPDDALAFTCRRVQNSDRVLRPMADEEPTHASARVCLGPDLMVAVYTGTCSRLGAYALKGCRTDPLCEKPEWDQTPAPPSWWPCH